MSTSQILWIDVQPSLYCLFKRTAQTLGQNFEVKRWSFEHDLDESCDVEIVHSLMRQTIENSSTPVHLVGHGVSGTIAYLYTFFGVSVVLMSISKSYFEWTALNFV